MKKSKMKAKATISIRDLHELSKVIAWFFDRADDFRVKKFLNYAWTDVEKAILYAERQR